MPLRSCTHASLVSMTRASAWLSIRRDGTAMPLPARSARGCAVRSGSGKAAARHAARHRVDPLDVERRQVADLDEAVERQRAPAVDARPLGPLVLPRLERRLVGERVELELDRVGLALQHQQRAAVGAASEIAGLGEALVGLAGALLEQLAHGVAGPSLVRVVPLPE